jgi:hypothetical protein
MDAMAKMQKDGGLKHPPTDFTLQFRQAVNGDGPRAYDWSDKPHRLIYDLCSYIEAAEAERAPGQQARTEP